MMKLLGFVFCYELILENSRAREASPGNLTDTNTCKLSHFGTEYLGYNSKTESLVRCQAWNTNFPHRLMDAITDEDFPENSKQLAKNYCRNPNLDPKGPWCYSLNEDLVNETCAVPLCSFSQCRLTGPGMEYAGEHKKTISDRNCLKWNKDRKRIERDGHFVKQDKFEKSLFPDQDLSKAGKKCRNPDGDTGGPWCFVENEENNAIEKDYCDIPLCDEPVCVVLTKNYETYTHFTDFDKKLDTLNFGVKLWDSDQYLEAEARLVLTVVAVSMGKKDMKNLGASIEIHISNKFTALTVNNKDEVEREPTRGILTSKEYTYFSLTWHRGYISLNKVGVVKPIFLAEYKTKNNLLGFKLDQFSYYAAQGTNILWTFPFCLNECDVHTTTGHFFQQYWPLRDTGISRELSFHLRAFRHAKISLFPTPVTEYPNILITFKTSDENTRVILKEHAGAPSVTLKELLLTDVLDYWHWQEYSMSLFGDTFQIHWTKNGGTHLVIDIKHKAFRKMRWYSVCSEDSVAHWTFFCAPPDWSKPVPAFLPECSMNPQEFNYVGTQDVTYEGFACLPWSAENLVPDFERYSFDGNASLSELAYCRDPGNRHEGTYCYVRRLLPEPSVVKKFCRIRKCISQECRMAGTGNDYTGTLNISRSRRYCETWISTNNHLHDVQYMNESLFPDRRVEDASNFCRNPSRNPIGSWCYTLDPQVPQESCLVKDCDRPEECIIILTGRNEGRKIYILPQWKEKGTHGGIHFALKRWNPEKIEGISLEITHHNHTKSIRLEIGAEGNQKVNLFLDGSLRKSKILPHLIASGTWTDFWLQIRQEEIKLGYKGVPHSLFEWEHTDLADSFDPTFISFSTMSDHYIGLYFKCDECHTELTSINNMLKVYPVGLWRESEKDVYTEFSLKIRGTGTVWIPLFNLIHTSDYLLLELNQIRSKISLKKSVGLRLSTLHVKMLTEVLFDQENWTNLTISFSENTFQIRKNNSTDIFTYDAPQTEPILIYYFSLGVEHGTVTWSVNCNLLDIDGPPRDGGWSLWSDWTCSVPCGGGDGFKTRSCTNPRPNIKGRLCMGPSTTTGKCNTFECGDLSPRTIDKIRQELQTSFFNFTIEENNDVKIPMNKKILEDVKKESPKSRYEWTLNGMLVDIEEDHFSLENGDIFISNAKPADSGLYICMLYRVDKNKPIIMRIVSLAVVPIGYTFITRATRRFALNCKSVVLGYVYSDLSMKIIVNKTIFKDYGTVTLAAVNMYNFQRIEQNMTGSWQCVVEQKDLGFSWTTNYENILVMKAPTLYTNLMEDELTKPLFGWLKRERNVVVALIVIISSCIVLVTLCLAIYFTFFTMRRRSYKRNRRI